MPLLKDNINALEISPELKADIMALFRSIEAKENEVETLRKKVPTDSQRVVESVDAEKWEAATKELETMKNDLASKLQQEQVKENGGKVILAAFHMFFE